MSAFSESTSAAASRFGDAFDAATFNAAAFVRSQRGGGALLADLQRDLAACEKELQWREFGEATGFVRLIV